MFYLRNKVASNSHDTLRDFVAGNSCAQRSNNEIHFTRYNEIHFERFDWLKVCSNNYYVTESFLLLNLQKIIFDIILIRGLLHRQ